MVIILAHQNLLALALSREMQRHAKARQRGLAMTIFLLEALNYYFWSAS